MFSRRLYVDCCTIILTLSFSYAAQSGKEKCSGPYEPDRCVFSDLNVTQSSNFHCSTEYMQDSFYHPPVIPGYCNLYTKIRCQVSMASNFSELGIDGRCLSEVEHAHDESDVACTLMNSSDSCWQINMYIRIGCDSELGNNSVIPLYGFTADHNSEHYCIYIRPVQFDNITTTTSTENPLPSVSFSPSTITTAESTVTLTYSTMASTAMTSTLITSSVLSLSPSVTSTLPSSISGEVKTSTSCSITVQLLSVETPDPPTQSQPTVIVGGLALTPNGLTTVSVLGVALIVVSVALVISCVCNIVIWKHKVANKNQQETGLNWMITNKGFEDSTIKLSPYHFANTS